LGNGAVPIGGGFDVASEVPNGLPLEEVEGFVDGETQEACLVKGSGLACIQPLAGPVFEDFGDKGFD
jgi:hypothetical protein